MVSPKLAVQSNCGDRQNWWESDREKPADDGELEISEEHAGAHGQKSAPTRRCPQAG
jgi:hypothetical protein